MRVNSSNAVGKFASAFRISDQLTSLKKNPPSLALRNKDFFALKFSFLFVIVCVPELISPCSVVDMKTENTRSLIGKTRLLYQKKNAFFFFLVLFLASLDTGQSFSLTIKLVVL